MKICPTCCYIGTDKFCPVCRRAGHVRLLYSADQLRRKLDRMRGEAVRLKLAIEKLEAIHATNP